MRALTRADVALQNSGGIRAGLPQGQVTRDMVFEVLPFENTIVTLVLTGAEVRRVLEEWLAAGRVTQVSGIRYRFDLERPAGARVTALLGPDGRPFDESRTYRVACNDFMAQGGDGAGTLAHGRDLVNSGISLREALEDRVREASAAGGTLDYREDGRVAAERP
jgi:2',3'-cyclic-nucleotide 2'-phosphodiesterase/3'-nucleotidase